jgi:hypothetical protein
MHNHNITGMVRALRPVLKDEVKAEAILRRYWQNRIAIVWVTEDVHRAANERGIAVSRSEARRTLQQLLDKHDAQYGINWEALVEAIEQGVFGRKLTRSEQTAFVEHDVITIRGADEK